MQGSGQPQPPPGEPYDDTTKATPRDPTPPTSRSPSEVSSLRLLASLTTSSTTRTWQSTPHPHKSLLATATDDKTVTVHSLLDFRLLSTISGGHKRSVRTVAWQDKGKGKETVLATGSFDASVGIWTKNDQSTATAVGVDDEMAMDVNGEGITDADTGEEEWTFTSLLTGPDSEIKSIAFAPASVNPNLLATSSRDKSVWLWEEVEETEYETVAVLQEHTGDVKCVAWHPSRELLASGSYDDTVRLWREVEEEDDWACVGVIDGHEGTVWELAWEAGEAGQAADMEEPRLASCSDDLSVRIWKKKAPSGAVERGGGGPRLPSILRPASSMETWVPDGVLPLVHVRSVYAIAWSSGTGLMVSCGGDGSIYVYKEVAVENSGSGESGGGASGCGVSGVGSGGDTEMTDAQGATDRSVGPRKEWVIVAQAEAAHGDFEINHVCWARRRDRDRRQNEEEVVISTGDDGMVKVWTLPEAIFRL